MVMNLQEIYGLIPLCCSNLRFLTRFGTCIALGYGVNSDMNFRDGHGSPEAAKHCAVILDSSEVQAMRHQLHELANVFTGVVIAAGLLSQYLEGGSLRQYAADICEGSERGCGLVRELRSRLLAACGELEAGRDGSPVEAAPDDPKF
jgi:hypothetical protein